MKKPEKKINLKDSIVNAHFDIEQLREDIALLKEDKSYEPKFDFKKFHEDYINRQDDKVLLDIIKELKLDYIDDSWDESDWAVVFFAGSIGILLDILITQTDILKPLDKQISNFMKSDKISDIQNKLDNFASSFRDGNGAPIDFQDFEMNGIKSIHEQYSFGHDPIRFIEGIYQTMTGNYRGVDKFGKIINTKFGTGIPNAIQAIISYLAHMVSDLLNSYSLPYPGSTYLMEFGSDNVRRQIAAAYRGKMFNMRTFAYQSTPSIFISMIIHSWAVYDNYVRTKEIKFKIKKSLKYQPMLLVSNAMVATSNLSINTVRMILNDPHALFRVNWPVLTNTVRHSFRYLINENRQININGKRIDEMYQQSVKNKIKKRTETEYLGKLESDYDEYEKNMEEDKDA